MSFKNFSHCVFSSKNFTQFFLSSVSWLRLSVFHLFQACSNCLVKQCKFKFSSYFFNLARNLEHLYHLSVLASVNGLFSFRDLPGSLEGEGFYLHVIETWIFGDIVRLRILLKVCVSVIYKDSIIQLLLAGPDSGATLQSHLLCETPSLSSSFLSP